VSLRYWRGRSSVFMSEQLSAGQLSAGQLSAGSGGIMAAGPSSLQGGFCQ
jgi:hypothetical protein